MAGDELVEVNLNGGTAGGLLWALYSSSPTTYFVDLRGEKPLMLRARGTGQTGRGEFDGQWLELNALVSGPPLVADGRELDLAEVDTSDIKPWWLRVGSRHELTYEFPGGPGFMEGYWIGRVLERIEALDEMPPDIAPTRSAEVADAAPGSRS